MIRIGPSFLLVTAFFIIIGSVLSSADDNFIQICPEGCHCSTEEYYTTLHCTSFNFIKKLTLKEQHAIESLDVSNVSLTSLDKHLVKKLVNLERLNLSHNRLTDIKHFPFLSKLTHLNLGTNLIKTLPGKQLANLEVLDISHNYIREIPSDLPKWSKLKRLYVGGNLFICSRESLDTRDALVDRKVKLIGNPICSTPAKFHGKSWIHADDFGEYIKLHNQDDMLADEPEGSGDVEGSGEVNPWTDPPTHEEENRESDFEFSGEGNIVDINPEIHDHTEHEEYTTVLYPGYDETREDDEGSGNLDLDDENDIFSTTEIIVEPIITTKKSIDLETVQKPTTEDVGEVDAVTKSPDGGVNEDLGSQEPQPNKSNQGSMGTNIFLVIMLFCLVAVLAYLIKKRKSNKRNARRKDDLEKQNAGLEMLPKSAVVNEKQNGNAETAPLMNGQNGDVEKEFEKDTIDAVNHSPESKKDAVLNDESTSSVGSTTLSTPPHSPKQNVLSVKVRASEIPDSIPSKPIIVDRRKTSDGQSIIVTPNFNQRVSPGD